jgi:hypothetical protein
VVLVDYFNDEKAQDSGEKKYGKNLKPWMKWAGIGIISIGAALGINHYTGDKAGIERLVSGGAKPAQASQAKPGSKLESLTEKNFVAWLRAEVAKKNRYLVWELKDGQPSPLAAEPVLPILNDNTYTAAKKLYFVSIVKSQAGYHVEYRETDEAFNKDVDAGKILIITGLETASPQSKTQAQTGQSAMRGLQQILR